MPTTAINPQQRKTIKLDFNTNGTNAIVADAAGYVRVYGFFLMGAADVNVTIQDNAGTTLSGPHPIGVKGNGFVLPLALPGAGAWFPLTASGKGLQIVLDGAVRCTGNMIYTQTTDDSSST